MKMVDLQSKLPDIDDLPLLQTSFGPSFAYLSSFNDAGKRHRLSCMACETAHAWNQHLNY